MAKTFPSDWPTVESTGAAQREIETLALLERTLPDAYTTADVDAIVAIVS